MKKSLFVIVSLITGCWEVRDGLEALNDAPLINFSDQQEVTVLQDSIKVSFELKDEPIHYDIRLRVFDPNDNLASVSYRQRFGRGLLIQGNDTITGNSVVVKEALLELEYYPLDLGLHQFELRAADTFGKESSALVELEAFDNLPPVAAYIFARDGQFGRRHWVFDASESFDGDERFGGRITAYEFRNGLGKIDVIDVPAQDVGESYEPWVYHVIFPEDNVYTVGVRVRDSDGEWSGLVNRTITIN